MVKKEKKYLIDEKILIYTNVSSPKVSFKNVNFKLNFTKLYRFQNSNLKLQYFQKFLTDFVLQGQAMDLQHLRLKRFQPQKSLN